MNKTFFDKATLAQQHLYDDAIAKYAGVAIGQFYYDGPIAGSEFETFAAGKGYVALEMELYSYNPLTANAAFIELYNEVNAVKAVLMNSAPVYNGVAVQYTNNMVRAENAHFSRLVAANHYRIKFIGYKIA